MSGLITELTLNDVILGRGLGPSQFPGNKQFLRIVRNHKAQYQEVRRDQKDTIVRAIVDHIRQTLGGRFVKEVDSITHTNRIWCEVDFEAALIKTKQALRERKNVASAADEEKSARSNDRKNVTQHPVARAREPSSAIALSLCPNFLTSLTSQALPGTVGMAVPGVAATPSAAGVAFAPGNNIYVPQASRVSQLQRNHQSNASLSLQGSPDIGMAILPVNSLPIQQQNAIQQMQQHSLSSLHGDLSIASQVLPPAEIAIMPAVQIQPLFLTRAGAPAFHTDLAALQAQMSVVNPDSPQYLRNASPNATPAPASDTSIACYPSQYFDDSELKPAAVDSLQSLGNSQARPAEESQNYVNHLIEAFGDNHSIGAVNDEKGASGSSMSHKRHIDFEDNVFSSERNDSIGSTNASSASCHSGDNIDNSAAIDFLCSAFVEDNPKFTAQEEQEERARLTAEQQAAAIADIFGNLCNISRSTKRIKRPMSDPQSVDSLLQQMRLEISNIPVAKKLPLIVAQEKGSPREFNDERLELFLCREDMDAAAAARRFVFYWEKRLEAFGPDKFYLPITQSGALRDDSGALQSGYISFLPNLDASGRQIMYVVPRNNSFDGYSEESVLRLRWYMFETASHHASAREGLVMLIHMKGATIWNFQRNAKRGAEILLLEREAWPVKFIATHVCQSPSVVQEYIRPIMLAKMDQRFRSRLVHHDAEGRALVEALARYGISEDVLPQEMGGKFEHDHAKWLASRRQAEEVEDLLLGD